jgi:G:T-mismatch repair DNA endonuclease (very short patch repair protein)
MVDTVGPERRSQIMAAIRSRDTTPELRVRRKLHAAESRNFSELSSIL